MAYGGVLEHPAFTHAWDHYYLIKPDWKQNYDDVCIYKLPNSGWISVLSKRYGIKYHVCEVWQSAYGHLARKRTWLLYRGFRPPFELNWTREPGTHQVGWFDRNKKTLSKKEASRTPEAFAKELIKLAEWSRDPV